MIRLAALLLILFVSAPVFAADPIVYSRCKAAPEDFVINRDVLLTDDTTVSVSKTFTGMTGYDVIPDVLNFLTNFTAPCDLVYRDAAGVETVIHDCSTSGSTPGQATCSALDAAVSFDGTQITYAVFEGTLENVLVSFDNRAFHENAVPGGTAPREVLPSTIINSTNAHLRTYVVSNGTNFDLTPSQVGVYDSGPAYIVDGDGNDRIAFTSSREGHTTNIPFRTTSSQTGYAIHSVNLDGTNIRLDSHHARTQEQHPLQLSDGRVAVSSWQIGGGQAHRKGNSPSLGVRTPHNAFQLWTQRADGSLPFALFGQHSNVGKNMSFGEDTLASHNIAQTTDGRVWTADYYRGNNRALGVIIGFTPEPEGREGTDPFVAGIDNAYVPNDALSFALWATNGDRQPLVVPNYPTDFVTTPNYAGRVPSYGKLGFPFALPGNVLGMVWGSGATCGTVVGAHALVEMGVSPLPYIGQNVSVVATEISEELVSRGLSGDIPGCNMGLYKSTVNPSVHPSDLELIVDSRDWHEIYPRAVVPYTDIHGIPKPAALATPKSAALPEGSPFAMLGAASITDRETAPLLGIRSDPFGFTNLQSFHMQGTDVIDYTDADLCGVRIMGQLPNVSVNTFNDIANVYGERIWILGEFNVRNRDVNGDPIIDASGNEDTSFLVRMPANMSYSMSGLDCDGRLLNTDQTWQSLQSREQKTCGGCHVHARDTRITFSQSVAGQPEYVPFVIGEGTVPLMAGVDGNGDPIVRTEPGYGYVPDYYNDIAPIFQSRCASCHSTSGLQEADLVLDNFTKTGNVPAADSTWRRLVHDNTQSFLAGSPFRFGTDTYFARPWLTKYMKAFDSRGSLLYWKAANQRTDNRTDAQFNDDIDFGVDHPTTITSEELGTLARWIELGAPAGDLDTLDTHDPTLVMSSTVDVNDHITELIIGAVDLGTGIDTGTLNVCLRNGPTCTNIAPAAQLHGITTIPLGSPISDMNQVIEATVSDVEGNSTTLVHTAEYLVTGSSSGSGTPSTVAINAGGNATVTEGDTFSRTVTFSDGEDTNADGWTVVVDWDGVTENINVGAGLSSFNISRLMPTQGSVPVTVTITDDVGETAQGSFTITVNASGGGGPLSISTGGDAIVNEGVSFTRTISLSDGDDTGGDGWTYTVDWGGLVTENGSIPAGSTSFDITRLMPDGDSRMTVNVTVTDVAGDVDSGSFQLTTLNVNPRGTITASDTVAVGALYSISISISDPGDDTIVSTSVDWGDGTFNNETSHTYTSPCSCRIRVQVVDEDGVHTVARKTVTVQ